MSVGRWMRNRPPAWGWPACALAAALTLAACDDGGGGDGGGGGGTGGAGGEAPGGAGGEAPGGTGGGGAGGEAPGGAGGEDPGGSGGIGGVGGEGGIGGEIPGGAGGEPGGPEFTEAARAAAPFDAVPSPDGRAIFFVAQTTDEDEEQQGAVFRVDAGGGEPARLAAGFAAPIGLTISVDGETIYVADVGYEAADGRLGAVWRFPAAGGEATVLASTIGWQPTGVDIRGNALYMTGRNRANGNPGVFSISPPEGEVIGVLAEGAPFVEPSGVAAGPGGDVFVTDATGALIRVRDGAAEALAEGIRVGFPAGVALTPGDMQVLISGLDPTTATAQVYVYDLTDGMVSTLTPEAISDRKESGGLHRAHDAPVLAWADVSASSGTVFRVRLN